MNALKQLRMALGMTQIDFATAIKRSDAQLRNYEAGRSVPVAVLKSAERLCVKRGRPELFKRLFPIGAVEEWLDSAVPPPAREPSNQQIFDAVMELTAIVRKMRAEKASGPTPAEEPSPRENARTGD